MVDTVQIVRRHYHTMIGSRCRRRVCSDLFCFFIHEEDLNCGATSLPDSDLDNRVASHQGDDRDGRAELAASAAFQSIVTALLDQYRVVKDFGEDDVAAVRTRVLGELRN